MTTIKWVIAVVLALFLGLVIGGTGGYFYGKQAQKNAQERAVLSALQDVRGKDAKSVADAQRTSQAISNAIEKAQDTNKGIQSEIQSNFEKGKDHGIGCGTVRPASQFSGSTDPTNDKERSAVDRVEVETAIAVGTHRLDLVTVCLLNAARSDRAATRSSCGGDAASQTPSETTVSELAVSDAEVSGLYHELAKRHNALVDWVEQVQSEQRKRLGILDK